MEHLGVDGVRIAFERRGKGPPLVLLHGLPGDSRMLARQVASLSSEHTVIAWDAPGCGQSDDLPAGSGTSEVARCAVGLIEQLGLDERPHVLGLSWGAGLALEVYRQAPQLPRSLVLACGYAGWAGSLPAEAVEVRLAAYLAAAASPDAIQGWGPGFFSPAAPPSLVDELLEIVAGFHPGPLADYARSFAETDLRAVLPAVGVPTLVVQAGSDVRSPMEVGQALHTAIPGAELAVLDGVGHVSNMEAPAVFDAAVLRFVGSVEA